MAGASKKIFSICVLGGTQIGQNSEYLRVANHLGRLLAEKRINLLYGGGLQGLPGCAAIWASAGGGKVVELNPTSFRMSPEDQFSKAIGFSTVHEKIQKMMVYSDAVIALPGGLETLGEIFQIASWAELKDYSKPFGLLNVHGFYDRLLTFLDYAVITGFMTRRARRSFICASNPEQLIEQLEAFEYKYDPIVAEGDWSGNGGQKRKAEVDLTLSL